MSEQPNTIHSACALDTTACAVPAGTLSSGLMRALSCCLRRAAPVVAMVLSATWLAPAHAEKPYSFWHSQPVKPGETVLVQGHGFNAGTTVQLQRLADGDAGAPGTALICPGEDSVTLLPHRTDGGAALSPTNLYFTLPKNINGSSDNGVFVYCLKNGTEVSAPKLINGPDVWFVQGDLGSRATTGGWIAVYGNGLSVDATGQVSKLTLVPELGGAPILVDALLGDVNVTAPIGGAQLKGNSHTALQGSTYAQYFQLPAVTPGKYAIHLHNGHGNSSAWRKYEGFGNDKIEFVEVVNASKVWTHAAESNKHIVNCTANVADNDTKFSNAITALSGGGVIEVGTGTCELSKALKLGNHIVLRGMGMDQTILSWTNPLTTPDASVVF